MDLTRLNFLEGLVSAVGLSLGGCRSWCGETLSFAFVNDFHERADYFDRVMPWIGDCDFTVVAGDILNDVRDDGSVQAILVESMDKLRRRTGAPCEFVRGNHETRGPAAERLHEMLGFRDGIFYRAKTIKGVRCVFLDTAENRPRQQMSAERYAKFETYLERERRWLEREVASADWRTARARLVFGHIPPAIVNPDADTRARAPIQRSVRREVPVNGLFDVLKTAGVTAMFAGHVHIGAFDEPSDEHPYPVVVGGGHSDPAERRLTEALLTRCEVASSSFTVRQIALDGTIRRERTFDKPLPL